MHAGYASTPLKCQSLDEVTRYFQHNLVSSRVASRAVMDKINFGLAQFPFLASDGLAFEIRGNGSISPMDILFRVLNPNVFLESFDVGGPSFVKHNPVWDSIFHFMKTWAHKNSPFLENIRQTYLEFDFHENVERMFRPNFWICLTNLRTFGDFLQQLRSDTVLGDVLNKMAGGPEFIGSLEQLKSIFPNEHVQHLGVVRARNLPGSQVVLRGNSLKQLEQFTSRIHSQFWLKFKDISERLAPFVGPRFGLGFYHDGKQIFPKLGVEFVSGQGAARFEILKVLQSFGLLSSDVSDFLSKWNDGEIVFSEKGLVLAYREFHYFKLTCTLQSELEAKFYIGGKIDREPGELFLNS